MAPKYHHCYANVTYKRWLLFLDRWAGTVTVTTKGHHLVAMQAEGTTQPDVSTIHCNRVPMLHAQDN